MPFLFFPHAVKICRKSPSAVRDNHETEKKHHKASYTAASSFCCNHDNQQQCSSCQPSQQTWPPYTGQPPPMLDGHKRSIWQDFARHWCTYLNSIGLWWKILNRRHVWSPDFYLCAELKVPIQILRWPSTWERAGVEEKPWSRAEKPRTRLVEECCGCWDIAKAKG